MNRIHRLSHLCMPLFAKRRIHIVVLIFILGLGFIFRVDSFRTYPEMQWEQTDYSRDYLVAHHIISYGEVPLTGPDGKFGTTHSSPVYFYFLALLLGIRDNIVWLGY
ncbi:MAG: hypothetical protein AAB972_04965, partial [Patescibacteria group bacterium]